MYNVTYLHRLFLCLDIIYCQVLLYSIGNSLRNIRNLLLKIEENLGEFITALYKLQMY
jgi:hypothetical protein